MKKTLTDDPRMARELFDFDGTRISVLEQLDKLFWSDPVAYIKLCNFCSSHHYKIDEDIKKQLIEDGFLYKDGGLPRSTNAAVYEATTGEKPPWL